MNPRYFENITEAKAVEENLKENDLEQIGANLIDNAGIEQNRIIGAVEADKTKETK